MNKITDHTVWHLLSVHIRDERRSEFLEMELGVERFRDAAVASSRSKDKVASTVNLDPASLPEHCVGELHIKVSDRHRRRNIGDGIWARLGGRDSSDCRIASDGWRCKLRLALLDRLGN
jgi:hypothetical protein